jgi:hypothetical protein
MLNHAICKRCSEYEAHPDYIVCPSRLGEKDVTGVTQLVLAWFIQSIPAWCEHKLEHCVSEAMEDAK